ncbi:MAG: MOSC domain-containing protein [Acidimicrobiia bacterium]
MRIEQLWRYPVKSLQGEPVAAIDVGSRGLAGDRSWALLDHATGLTLTARRVPELLFATGVLDGDGQRPQVHVRLPDGTETDDDGALSRWLGRDVALVAAADDRAGTYEIAVDAEREDTADWVTWTGPTGSFHDSKRTQVSIIGRETLRDWSVRRFRPNVVVTGGDEDGLVGRTVTSGSSSLALDVVKRIDRCVMVTRPQPGGIERDLDVLRTVNRERDTFLGVGALVRGTGTVAVGDELTIAGEIADLGEESLR